MPELAMGGSAVGVDVCEDDSELAGQREVVGFFDAGFGLRWVFRLKFTPDFGGLRDPAGSFGFE